MHVQTEPQKAARGDRKAGGQQPEPKAAAAGKQVSPKKAQKQPMGKESRTNSFPDGGIGPGSQFFHPPPNQRLKFIQPKRNPEPRVKSGSVVLQTPTGASRPKVESERTSNTQ